MWETRGGTGGRGGEERGEERGAGTGSLVRLRSTATWSGEEDGIRSRCRRLKVHDTEKQSWRIGRRRVAVGQTGAATTDDGSMRFSGDDMGGSDESQGASVSLGFCLVEREKKKQQQCRRLNKRRFLSPFFSLFFFSLSRRPVGRSGVRGPAPVTTSVS
jgi:hypothetical protein